jgi:hypothetical protein
MHYAWRDLRFEVEDGLTDQSMVVLAKPGGVLPRYTLSIGRDALGGRPLAGYVDEALRELTSSLSGYRLERRENKTVAGRAAVLVDQSALSPEGKAIAQRQAFISDGDSVVVVTGTTHEAQAEAQAAVDRVLQSLKSA